MTTLTGTSRGRITLGKELARGGEGKIHELQGDPKALVKIYLQPLSKEKIAKLEAMVANVGKVGPGLAAWPSELVKSSGSVVGFIMNRVRDKQDAHHLYSPKSRAAAFPEANFKFLVHVAANLANAFGAIHELGVVIGDVNHGSTLVGADGTVSLIDCDSFQFHDGAKLHTCDVGSPLYLPPELQNQPLRGRRRDLASDHFGLATLLFHILFMGRHPFAGVYSGPEDMPIEKAIAQSRFAYGQNGERLRMKRPPGTLKLETHGPDIALLFERAFGPPLPASPRPTPREWAGALKALGESLTACAESSAHHYHRGLSKCPWCELESTAPIRLFGHKFTSTPTGATNVEALWSAIAQVTPPPEAIDPGSRDTRKRPTPGAKASRSLQKWFAVGIAIVGMLAFQAPGLVGGLVLAAILWPRIDATKLAAANAALQVATSKTRDLWAQWDDKAKSRAFENRLRDLEKVAKSLRHLPTERAQALQSLEARKRELQLAKFLDRFEIAKASVPLIGLSRAATLASHGIETAADVDKYKIEAVGGFGPRMAANLVEWRDRLTRQFTFDASQPTDPRDIAEIERKFFEKRRKLVTELQNGPNQLRQIAAETLDARRRILPALQQAIAAENEAYQAVTMV
jgi:DNA-binding helix-hairpin-helix protein with protein kinase domain